MVTWRGSSRRTAAHPGNLRAGPFGRTVKDARLLLKQLKDIFVLRAAHADWDIRFKR